jgi:hypothetical protein
LGNDPYFEFNDFTFKTSDGDGCDMTYQISSLDENSPITAPSFTYTIDLSSTPKRVIITGGLDAVIATY